MKVILKNTSLVFLSRPKVTTYSIKSEGFISSNGVIVAYAKYFVTNPIKLYPKSTIELYNQSAIDVMPLSTYPDGREGP